VKNKSPLPSKTSLKMSDDEIRESVEGAQLKLQRERGTDVTIFSPRASGMGHHIGDESVSLEWSQILQRSDRTCDLALSEEFHRRMSAAAVAGRAAEELDRGARTLHHQARLRRLQSQSGSVRRLFQRAALTDKWWYRSTRSWSSSTCRR